MVSIGIDPLIAAYNGFYVLDSYQVLYPLNYKTQFRKIIQKELDKDTNLKNYFDGWGNCCYMLIGDNPTKDMRRLGSYRINQRITKPIQNLEINTEILQSLGAEYIISCRQIINFKDNRLFPARIFQEGSQSPLFLYKIQKNN